MLFVFSASIVLFAINDHLLSSLICRYAFVYDMLCTLPCMLVSHKIMY